MSIKPSRFFGRMVHFYFAHGIDPTILPLRNAREPYRIAMPSHPQVEMLPKSPRNLDGNVSSSKTTEARGNR